jgi:hypothetical protein
MFGTSQQQRERAHEAFRRLHNQAARRQLWAFLTKQEHALPSLESVTTANTTHNASHRGIQSVPIGKIRGSEGRSHDFDTEFRPLNTASRDRWVNIAVAHERDELLPAVDLIQVNDIYFVRDGHHRISVARMVGQQEIDAHVITWNMN